MYNSEFIKSLSINDKKTLSQKALKTCEEVGELAKVILPFDSAPGSNHRFVDKERVLEEIADVYLTNISIAYSMGFTDDQIEDMINKKSIKWSEMQSKEDSVNFPLPYEIHLTIKYDIPKFGDSKHKLSYITRYFEKDFCKRMNIHIPPETKFEYTSIDFDANIERVFIENFKSRCKSIGVKPIVLDLEVNDSVIKDVMTSSKHFGDNKSVYQECERISRELEEDGFTVLRKKIETVPWHIAAPIEGNGSPIANDCYFESHIGIILPIDEKQRLTQFVNILPDLINLNGTCKLSKNFFKKTQDGKFINILTYRNNIDGYRIFNEEVEEIKKHLLLNEFNFEKVEIEFAIYDSNISHDNIWMKG